MGIKKFGSGSATEYTVTYSGMGGVAFDKADGGDKRFRFSYLENMYKDYTGGSAGCVESIPGFRKTASLGAAVHGIYSQRGADGERYMIVHAGDGLYRFTVSDKDEVKVGLKKLATLKDGKSSAFNSGHDIFVMDGESIVRLRSDGTSSKVADEEDAAPYVPTTFINGMEYEQRNLLTNRFKEKYLIASANDSASFTEGLQFAVISEEEGTAAITGIDEGVSGYVYVPSYTLIGEREYKVTEIASNAFRTNKTVTSLILSDTVEKIGDRAFMLATALKEVITRDSLTYIGELAFTGCDALDTLYLGAGISFIGMDCLSLCTNLKQINYAKDAEAFGLITSRQDFSNFTINYSSYSYGIRVEIPIYSPAESIISVKLGNEVLADYETKMKDGLIGSVMIDKNLRSELDGKEVTVEGVASPSQFTRHSVGSDFLEEFGETVGGYDAIIGCTVCACFDGRVFVTGNPMLPSTVFYSSRDETGKNNPLYFGALNYFNDGVGSFGIGSLLATGDSLAVFKRGDDGGGSIYYHTPRETGIDLLPKIYPVSYIHSGIYAKGPAISFYDDPIFISGLGVTALDKKAINLERSIAVRSSNINSRLLSEDLENVMLAKWCGYLIVLAKDHMYLADSRDTFVSSKGHTEYEWYYATDINSYSGGSYIYRFSEAKEGGVLNYPNPHEEVTTPIFQEKYNQKARTVTYVGGIKYLVYQTNEKRGGSPSAATAIGTYEDAALFFGTESGEVFRFNNDMRGKAPPYVSELSDYDEASYADEHGNEIHPYYYSHDGYAPTYALKTVDDDGGIPNLTKSTVKGSLTVRLHSRGKSRVKIEVGTENDGYFELADLTAPSFDFRELDFNALSFTNDDTLILPIKDRSKNWIKKSVAVYTREAASPFALESITYRFKIKGKIKY